MGHGHHLAVTGGQEGGCQGDIANVAAGNLESPGQEVRSSSVLRGCLAGQILSQMRRRLFSSGKGNSTVNCRRRMKASSMFSRRLVARMATPSILLHPLQQVADLDVGVAVVGVLHFRAFAEEGIGLVEEENGVAGLGFGEDALPGSFRSRRCTC